MDTESYREYYLWDGEERETLDEEVVDITDGDLNCTGILLALYAGVPGFTYEWKQVGAGKALDELDLTEDVLQSDIRTGWEINYNIDRSETPQVKLATGSIRVPDQQQAQFETADDRRAWKSRIVKTAVEHTIRSIAESFSDADYTGREFLSYHLQTSFDAEEAADILTDVLDSDQSSGSVRKYASRANSKLEEAIETVDLVKERSLTPVANLPTLTSPKPSPLTDRQKTEMYHALYRELHTTDGGVMETRDWEAAPGVRVIFEARPKTIGLHVYHEVSDLPEPVVVDGDNDTDSKMISEGSPTKLTELGSQYYSLLRDIDDVMAELAGASVEQFTIHHTPIATTAHPEMEDHPGFVDFYSAFPIGNYN